MKRWCVVETWLQAAFIFSKR